MGVKRNLIHPVRHQADCSLLESKIIRNFFHMTEFWEEKDFGSLLYPTRSFFFLFLIISGAYDAFARHFTGQGAGFAFIGFILVLLFCLLAVLALFACIKRCRDCNISLWWSVLFSFIPITGLYLFFATTKVDLNKYSKSSSDYLQSEEYLESKKTAKSVIYTILFIYLFDTLPYGDQ